MPPKERPGGAPGIKSTSQGRAAAWSTYKTKPDLHERIRKMKEEAKFYDPSAPGTRKRRTAILHDFEHFAKEHLELEDNAVWDSKTIIDHQMEYLAGLANIAKGVLNEKVKVGTLYAAKHAFYWWNVKFIDDFTTIYLKWNLALRNWVHQVATEFELPTASYEKHNLTDTELSMLFRVMDDDTFPLSGIDNYFQHYVIWVLSWVTGARPGSITLASGYRASDKLSNGKARGHDETLRWEDIEWFKDGGELCFRLRLRYNKGHRDPYLQNYVSSSRLFLFAPLKSSRYELDLTLLLLALAVKRGLFTLEYALTTEDAFLKPDPVVNLQPVFVSADAKGNLQSDVPLPYDALNPKLRDGCVRAGLPARNTMYSFRRTALSETLREHGLEMAKKLAGHTKDSEVLEDYYDEEDMGDIDIQGWRLGVEHRSRKDLSAQFRQAFTSVYRAHEGYDHLSNLRAECRSRVEVRLREEAEYVQAHRTVKDLTDTIHAFLDTPEKPVSRGYSGKITGLYKSLLSKHESERAAELLDDYENAFYGRRVTLQRVRKRLRNVILDEIAKEMKILLKDSEKTASRSASKEKGAVSRRVSSPSKKVGDDLIAYHTAQVDAVDALRRESADEDDAGIITGEESEKDVDLEALMDQDTRAAPADWDKFEPAATLQVSFEGEDEADETATAEKRLGFLKSLLAKKSMESSDLYCYRCQQDPTIPAEQKNKKWQRALLNRHIKGNAHTRRDQLRNAFNAYYEASGLDKIPCILCAVAGETAEYSSARTLLRHVSDHHPEEFWEPEVKEEDSDDDLLFEQFK